MTADIIRIAREAGFGERDSYLMHEELARFAELAAAAERQKHQADIERWKAEAATAEKWRGLACSSDGDGRTVQRIQQEATAVEREACAVVADSMTKASFLGAVGQAIRARGQA